MLRGLALLLTVLTGFSGLVYEVAWQKYLAVLLGSHAEATAAVLAIFLGGLATGYAVFGALTRRLVERAVASTPRLLGFYGVVEASIGIWALLFPWLFGLAERISFWIPSEQAALAFVFDLLLTALLIGPPTVLMGGTIPILTQALSRGVAESSRVHAWVYGFNTAGAFFGALAAGFLLVPWLGLDGVVRAMGAVNLSAGIAFAVLQRWYSGAAASSREPAAAADVEGFPIWATVALLAGFAMMTIQVILNRVGGLALGTSHFTFAMVVAVFVLCIALGSLGVSVLPHIPRLLIVGSQWALVASLVLLYPRLPDAPYWAHVVRSLFPGEDTAFYRYHLLVFGGALAVLVVPIGLSGALLPLLFHHLRREVGDLGATAGRIYAWNTVGSLLGAVVGGYALFVWLDLHQVFRVALAALVVSSALLTVRVMRLSRYGVVMAAVALALAGVAWLPEWSPERLASGMFRLREAKPWTHAGPEAAFGREKPASVVFYRDDPIASVSVKESHSRDGRLNRAIVTDGKPDGALIGDYPTMALLALLPAILADEPSDCFVIGYGTGVTAGELGVLFDVHRVEVAEISSGVIDAAPLFDYGNQDASLNPKVQVLRTDAYRALLRSSRRYGVIVSEPSNPWRVGVEMLYSREFLEVARGRLAPGGVYAQWFHLYEVDTATVNLVLRTYASVFDHVSIWFTTNLDVIFLGFERPDHALDLARLRARFQRSDYRRAFRRIEIQSLPALLTHEIVPLGAIHAVRLMGDVHTLRRPVLSHRAARAFFRGESGELPRFARLASARTGGESSLLGRLAGRPQGGLREDALQAAIRESCRHNQVRQCAALAARYQHDYPGSPDLAGILDEVRRNPGLAKHLQPSVLQWLRVLYGEGAAPDRDVRALQQLTQLYERSYQHAAPFSRQALARAWQHCRPERDGPEGCARGRAWAERRVGPLVR